MHKGIVSHYGNPGFSTTDTRLLSTPKGVLAAWGFFHLSSLHAVQEWFVFRCDFKWDPPHEKFCLKSRLSGTNGPDKGPWDLAEEPTLRLQSSRQKWVSQPGPFMDRSQRQ